MHCPGLHWTIVYSTLRHPSYINLGPVCRQRVESKPLRQKSGYGSAPSTVSADVRHKNMQCWTPDTKNC